MDGCHSAVRYVAGCCYGCIRWAADCRGAWRIVDSTLMSCAFAAGALDVRYTQAEVDSCDDRAEREHCRGHSHCDSCTALRDGFQ